jgi:sugar/nucleoside kinase (ribokinase family)
MQVLCAGSFVVDIVVPHLISIPQPGGLVYAPRGITVGPGGHAANVSIDLAQLGQRDVVAAGCIGDDAMGHFMVGCLQVAGVEPRPEVVKAASTAKNIAITVEGEDRRFISELSANSLLSSGHLIKLLEFHPRLFYLGTVGGLKFVDAELTKVLRAAHQVGAAIVVDVIPPMESDWGHLLKGLREVDFLHCNDVEARMITGEEDPVEAAFRLVNGGAGTAIVSRGGLGLVAVRPGEAIEMPAFDVDEVDTTGAGDALCAGFAHFLLGSGIGDLRRPDTSSLRDALVEGQAAGAACVTAPGATTAVTFSKVLGLIESQRKSLVSKTVFTQH